MEKIYSILISISLALNAILVIYNFMLKMKRPIEVVADKKLKDALEPLKIELNEIKKDIQRLDKNQCKNYLTEFLEDLKKGIKKTDIEKQRATEVYDHYRNELHLNTYIHDEWKIYMKQGEEK